MKKTMTAKVEITEEQIVNLFISACEGGSNYWCHELTPHGRKGDAYEAMLGGFTVVESENGKKTRVTKAMIKKAVEEFPIKEPRHFGDFISENDDSITADVFLQLCVFGETIYG